MANVTRNHKAGPNMGDGNSGSILDFESPQNTLKYKRVFSDPKTEEEVSRVSESLWSQATSLPLLRLPGDRADSRPVHRTPGVLTATPEANDLLRQQQRLRARQPPSHKPETWLFPPHALPKLSRPQTSEQPNSPPKFQ